HVERVGSRCAAGVGGDRGERPAARRQCGVARSAVAVPARAPGHPGSCRRSVMSDLAHRRSDYAWGALDRADLADDPIPQWWTWYEAAVAAGIEEPNAMSVATIHDDGGPDARLVLARGVDSRGFAFFTNYASTKGNQLAERPVAAATFAWLELH